ncbi:MAG TPA: hypoxanthine phosphoribosyltransferase [Candidatus Polarisedimenticolia bacterium]|jgi:hypoxanthine phosphoribosyltransferase|nr:hypoxanthine phosphoribosyltransferase [Candidatus Polarisedimenticolia bacterium]
MNLAKEILKSEAEIADRVRQLGGQITADHEGKDLAVLGILKGSFVFLADLIRQIDLPQQVGFLEITHSPKSEFLTEILFSSSFRVEGTNLLVVEDILDTGITLAYLCQQLESKKPKSIRVCTLLDKPQKRKVDIQPDYLGFTVPNRHVVGYGLDHEGRFRNLPYLTYVE